MKIALVLLALLCRHADSRREPQALDDVGGQPELLNVTEAEGAGEPQGSEAEAVAHPAVVPQDAVPQDAVPQVAAASSRAAMSKAEEAAASGTGSQPGSPTEEEELDEEEEEQGAAGGTPEAAPSQATISNKVNGNSSEYKFKVKDKTEGHKFEAKDKIKRRGNVVKEKLKIKTKTVLAEGESYYQGDALVRFEKEFMRALLKDLVAEDPDIVGLRQYTLGVRLFVVNPIHADFEEVGGGVLMLVLRRTDPKFQLIVPGHNRLPQLTYNVTDFVEVTAGPNTISFQVEDRSQPEVKIVFRDTWAQAKFQMALLTAIVGEQGLTPMIEAGESAEEEGEAPEQEEEQEEESEEESDSSRPGQAGASSDDVDLPSYGELFGPSGNESHGEDEEEEDQWDTLEEIEISSDSEEPPPPYSEHSEPDKDGEGIPLTPAEGWNGELDSDSDDGDMFLTGTPEDGESGELDSDWDDSDMFLTGTPEDGESGELDSDWDDSDMFLTGTPEDEEGIPFTPPGRWNGEPDSDSDNDDVFLPGAPKEIPAPAGSSTTRETIPSPTTSSSSEYEESGFHFPRLESFTDEEDGIHYSVMHGHTVADSDDWDFEVIPESPRGEGLGDSSSSSFLGSDDVFSMGPSESSPTSKAGFVAINTPEPAIDPAESEEEGLARLTLTELLTRLVNDDDSDDGDDDVDDVDDDSDGDIDTDAALTPGTNTQLNELLLDSSDDEDEEHWDTYRSDGESLPSESEDSASESEEESSDGGLSTKEFGSVWGKFDLE